MGYPVGVHAVDEAEVIDLPGNVREELRNQLAAFTVAFEAPGRFHHPLRSHLAAARDAKLDLLPVVLIKARLVVEGVYLARSALHEDEDDALRPRSEMRFLRCQRRGFRHRRF